MPTTYDLQPTQMPATKKYILKKPVIEPVASAKFKIRYENELNPAQLEAVTTVNGPILVIAGAGKTRTLTYRVARFIELGVKPESVLLLTFTRKAAQEMLHRAALFPRNVTEESQRLCG